MTLKRPEGPETARPVVFLYSRHRVQYTFGVAAVAFKVMSSRAAPCARPPTTFPATLSLRPTSAASPDLPRLSEQG